ncbi:hypothetical protein EYR40_006059 [Pleurotus pulmonarius]|nr:hypothetical protein EYR36_005561 [Pleurotus pulmonarius]KAF4602841.1 hypothetical protein EYR40_006059 [Pleurotus pulmonarius]
MAGHPASYVPYSRLPNEPSASWGDHRFLAGLVEYDPFINIEAMISGIQHATEVHDLKRLQHEIEMLATNISSGTGQNAGILAEIHNTLPVLLSTVEFMRTDLGTHDNTRDAIILTLFLALASLEPHANHKLPLATFREVAQGVAGVFKAKNYPGVLRHANGDDTRCVNLIQC